MPNDLINTTANEIEKFLRERLTSEFKRTEHSNENEKHVTIELVDNLEAGRLWWASVRMIETLAGTLFMKDLESRSISLFCEGDTSREIELKLGYTNVLTTLYIKIMETFGIVGDTKAQPEEPAKPKRKSKKLKMPTRPADAERWVTAWEQLEPKLDEDPTLEKDMYQLIEFLGMKEDTIRKIIQLGKAKRIPSRAEFQRKNKL